MSPSRPAPLVLATVVALAAAAVLPAAAPAAGFGEPRLITPKGAAVDHPVAAVGPGGRTAVLWRTFGRDGRRFGYAAAFGRSPDRVGRPVPVPAGVRAARSAASATVLARPGGGFVACFGDDPRRGTAVVGCAVASRAGRFGPLRAVSRRPWRERPQVQAVVRPDGQVVVLTSRRIAGRRIALRVGVLDASGRLRGARRLAEIPSDAAPSLAATDDGAVFAAWSTGRYGSRTPVLRVMAPGSERFGPPAPFLAEARIEGDVGLRGGASLIASYAAAGVRYVRRAPDGTFGPPFALPGVGGGRSSDEADVFPLADGSPFAITMAARGSDDDCGGIVSGAVGAGPLVPFGTTGPGVRLSTARQIALYPAGAALRDGTVVAVWRDADGPSGGSRLEVALRLGGRAAFSRPQVLPRLAARDFALAAGGDHAVLAWVTGSLPDGPSRIVVSGLRRTGPYAAAAPRPARPGSPCV